MGAVETPGENGDAVGVVKVKCKLEVPLEEVSFSELDAVLKRN